MTGSGFDAKPGQVFAYENLGEELRLTLLKPAPKADTVHFIKKHGYTVAAGTRPISHEQVRAALDGGIGHQAAFVIPS
jgi:hypothetical protein